MWRYEWKQRITVAWRVAQSFLKLVLFRGARGDALRVREYLELRHGKMRLPTATVEQVKWALPNKKLGNNQAAVALPEDFVQSVVRPGRALVFVIDCSNEMAGAPLCAAKAACRQLLDQLHEGQPFNLVAYGSDTLSFDHQLHAASAKTKALAGEFLDLLDVMNLNPLVAALKQVLLHAQGERIDLVLLLKGCDSSLHEVIRMSRELAVRVHCIDYSGAENAFLRLLAEKTEGNYLVLPEPQNAQPIARETLPTTHGCIGTALYRRGRPRVPFDPELLVTALTCHLRGSSAEPFDWADSRYPGKLVAGLAELRKQGVVELELLTGLLKALDDLCRMGSLWWPARGRGRADIALELRILVMASYREWCLREAVFKPRLERYDIPPFLRRGYRTD